MPYSALSIPDGMSSELCTLSMSWIIFLKRVYACVGIEAGAVEGKAALRLFHHKVERVNIQVLTPTIIFLRW